MPNLIIIKPLKMFGKYFISNDNHISKAYVRMYLEMKTRRMN